MYYIIHLYNTLSLSTELCPILSARGSEMGPLWGRGVCISNKFRLAA